MHFGLMLFDLADADPILRWGGRYRRQNGSRLRSGFFRDHALPIKL